MIQLPLKERAIPCKPCGGTGGIFCGEDVECIRCGGTGWVKPSDVAEFDAIFREPDRLTGAE